MRKLHIQSENEKVFLENLRELMLSGGISKLKADAEEVSRKLLGNIRVFGSNHISIQSFIEFENACGFYLVGENKNIFLVCEEKPEVFIETTNVLRHVDLARVLKLYRSEPDVLILNEI